jgi:hypothetical protein
MLYFDSQKKIILNSDTLNQKKTKIFESIHLYSKYGMQIKIFGIAAYNAMNVVKATLIKSDLDIDELNQLKDVFFRNIGSIQLGVIEDISEKIKLYYESFDASDEADLDLMERIEDVDLGRANIWLRRIVEFRNTYLTEEIINRYRQNWITEFGEHA